MSKAFGVQSPNQGEDAVSWQTWSDGVGGIPDIEGDSNWGKLKLDLSGEEGRSAVYDLGSEKTRTFTLTENRYGTGEDDATLQIRGSATSFDQDDVSPLWIDYSSAITQSWRYVQVRVITNRFLSMWLQPEDIDTKDEIDAIITFAAAHGFTDLFASFTDWNTNPKTTLGNSTTGNITAKRADGKYPYTYLIEQATANGIRVHAWVVCNFFYHWGGSSAVLLSPLADNADNHSTTNGGDCFNFSTEAARDAVTDYIADISASNPGIASLHLDYIRTDGEVTDISLQDVTDFVSELRAKTSTPISVDSLSSKIAVTSHKQDAVSWIQNGYIDFIVAMGYEMAYGIKYDYFSQYDFAGNNKKLVFGHGAMVESERPSDFEANLIRYIEQGHNDFTIFSWADDLKDNSDYADIIDKMHNGTLGVSMGDITKVTVTPGTSIALTIGGTEYTTLFSNVTGYTTQGTLKAYIESQEGARPYVYYMRKATDTIQIMIGDFEP